MIFWKKKNKIKRPFYGTLDSVVQGFRQGKEGGDLSLFHNVWSLRGIVELGAGVVWTHLHTHAWQRSLLVGWNLSWAVSQHTSMWPLHVVSLHGLQVILTGNSI